MQEGETITKYSDRLSLIVNRIRLLGEDFKDNRIVEKILTTISERFESKISALEESKDLSAISLAELISALQVQEQRKAYREDKVVESIFYIGVVQVVACESYFTASESTMEILAAYHQRSLVPGKFDFQTLELNYIGVGNSNDVQLFYYFVMSESNPKSDPLILWLTGGPDCSALFSLLCEIGSIMLEPMEYGDYKPAQYNNSFPSLVLNPHTWIKGSGGNNLYLIKACVRFVYILASQDPACEITRTINKASEVNLGKVLASTYCALSIGLLVNLLVLCLYSVLHWNLPGQLHEQLDDLGPYLWSEHIVLRETGIAGLVPFAIGLETSGSITYPASHFGVMALWPTF
ncbi:hypothetical protein FXO38_11690 [Capsicum annuum]|nr:hypothetical protein FXO37_33927 [Capsicum annuum]KAF3661441.1 hypothetical protein FXO38_11690 [Capsicum annuum]